MASILLRTLRPRDGFRAGAQGWLAQFVCIGGDRGFRAAHSFIVQYDTTWLREHRVSPTGTVESERLPGLMRVSRLIQTHFRCGKRGAGCKSPGVVSDEAWDTLQMYLYALPCIIWMEDGQ